jgi:TM2 domain-containing membrane protein YozV
LVKVEKSRMIVAADRPPAKAWLMGFVAWLIPGVGHFLQGCWGRGVLLAAAVWICFITGLLMGGHMFSLNPGDQSSSILLQFPPMIANLGAGLLYIGSWLLGVGFSDDPVQAARATYEYGNTFLLIAGLLNYLAMLDAFDIAAGRKS